MAAAAAFRNTVATAGGIDSSFPPGRTTCAVICDGEIPVRMPVMTSAARYEPCAEGWNPSSE
jgi:hypothetical protein